MNDQKPLIPRFDPSTDDSWNEASDILLLKSADILPCIFFFKQQGADPFEHWNWEMAEKGPIETAPFEGG